MPKKVKPVLRYPGGKSRVANTILKYIPNDYREFREPFVGGGSIFIALKQAVPDSTHFAINDINSNVSLFWKVLQEDGKLFKNTVVSMKDKFGTGRELFKYYRDRDAEWSDFERAVRFFILNRITFSGLIDSGGYSQESYDKRFTDSIINRLIPLSNLIQNIEITNTDYSEFLEKDGEDVFLYLDPPYFSSTKSMLYGKNGDLHKNFEHEKFARNIKKCKHQWLITYDDSPEIRGLFDFAHITCWEMAYGMTNVNREKSRRGNELIITNYEI